MFEWRILWDLSTLWVNCWKGWQWVTVLRWFWGGVVGWWYFFEAINGIFLIFEYLEIDKDKKNYSNFERLAEVQIFKWIMEINFFAFKLLQIIEISCFWVKFALMKFLWVTLTLIKLLRKLPQELQNSRVDGAIFSLSKKIPVVKSDKILERV